MPHRPDSDMSIDSDVNAGYPFAAIGQLYREAIASGWTEDDFLDKLTELLPSLAAAPKPSPALTARIENVSPVVNLDFANDNANEVAIAFGVPAEKLVATRRATGTRIVSAVPKPRSSAQYVTAPATQSIDVDDARSFAE